MNDELHPEWTWPEGGVIGYTLLDDTGPLTNSAGLKAQLIRVPEGARAVAPLPRQETGSDRWLSVCAVILLVGSLLGFLTLMVVNRVRKGARR